SVLLLGIFLKLKASLDGKSTEKSILHVYTPLLEILKSWTGYPSGKRMISDSERKVILFSWLASTFLAVFFLPLGRFTFFQNLIGDFQAFFIFAMLMVYPLGLMVICYSSEKKTAFLNLRPLSEDFFSISITYLISVFSLMIINRGCVFLDQFVSIEDLIRSQTSNYFPIENLQIPAINALYNPFAMLAVFSIIPTMQMPYKLNAGSCMQKWQPFHEFTGKSLASVQIIEAFRFLTAITLFADLFFGGFAFFKNDIMNFLMFLLGLILITTVLTFAKSRKKSWFLERKISGFLRVHNVLAILALIHAVVII
ncbi:MAG: NADH-quinone oxidoreductase subunit H, partial [Promethearchaeota archaeon]